MDKLSSIADQYRKQQNTLQVGSLTQLVEHIGTTFSDPNKKMSREDVLQVLSMPLHLCDKFTCSTSDNINFTGDRQR